MYPLGDQFLVDYRRAKSDPKNCVTGKNYRISIITDRVVRLEYSPSGVFVDMPSQLVLNRNLGVPVYTIRQDPNILQITTKYFELTYMKEQPFQGNSVNPSKNLKITLLSKIDKDRQRDWYYKHPEVRNMKGNISAYDIPLNSVFERGLYSVEGFASFDDSENKLLEKDGTLVDRVPGYVDVYVFMYDKDFKEALVDYFKITGFPELLPRYALGNWWSRNLPYNEEGIRDVIYNFEKKRIPLSVIVLDHGWHVREYEKEKDLETGFTFNSNLFPNPAGIIKELHEKNIRVGLAVNPEQGFYPIDSFYSKVLEYLGDSNNTIVKFDPLNPKVLDIYFKMYLHPLESLGVDFFWNDFKDTKSINKMWSMTHYMYHDSDRSANKRGLVLSRGSIVAPQRYPVIYGGDTEITWEDLAP